MFGMVAHVEFLVDLVLAQRLADLFIGQKLFAEIGAVLPDFQGVALHHCIGIFAGDTGLGEGQKHALAHDEAGEFVHIVEHVVGEDQHLVDHACQACQCEIERDGGVGADHALHRAVRDIALVPQCYVFHRGDHGHADGASQTSEVFGEDRVLLMRHGRRAFLAHGEELRAFQNLRALHVADFGGDVLDAGGHHAQCREKRRVAVAGDNLGGDRLRAQAQLFADMLFHARVDIGKCPDGA